MKSDTDNTPRKHRRLARRLASLAFLSLALLSLFSVPGNAAVVTGRPFLHSFDGSDTSAGAFRDERSIAIDQATGDIYVLDGDRKVLDKFNAAGEAQDFSSTGESSLSLDAPEGLSAIAVDNSSAHPGRIYVATGGQGSGTVLAFDPAGSFLWELKREVAVKSPCGVAVDSSGNVWVGDSVAGEVLEFASAGSPPAQIGGFEPEEAPCQLAVDATGNVYMQREIGGGHYRIDKYSSGGSFLETIDPLDSAGLTVDQSGATGHVFTVHSGLEEGFDEYDSSGALVGHFGKGNASNAFGVAYNHALDRVYVANARGHKVEAFGSMATGTVPDVTVEAPSAIGVSKATFHGKVNPQSVPNSYFFQWKAGLSPTGWGEAESSPQVLPEDSSEHTVSLNVGELKGSTTYQMRLVALNTANGLREVSSPETFNTLRATAPPSVTIGVTTPVTTTTARLHATINPKEDFGTTYRFETSTDPACATGFSQQPEKQLESEADSPVGVEEELTGLLPNKHYCARITATNGAVTNEIQQLKVDAGSGSYKLSFGASTTASIPSGATFQVVQEKLKELASIGGVGGTVFVEGGPGDAGGNNPYLIYFQGSLGEKDVQQLVATNAGLSGGAATATVTTIATGAPLSVSTATEFTTLTAVPSNAFTAFAAPRTDTSARLNGRVDPEGADVTYRFEWSADGGATWNVLPDLEDTSRAREQILVSEELPGLDPATSYQYRFSVEDSAGPAAPQGEAKILTTRSTAEVTSPSSCPNEDVRHAQHTASYLGHCRGIELVSKPDKGNQHARAEVLTRTSPLRADGNAAVWNVLGGAPGGNSGAGATFLSRRTGPSEAAPNGWESRSLVPAGAEQIGEAEAGGYFPYTMTPDLSSFVFNVGKTAFLEGHAIARVDADGTQTPLEDYANEINPLDAPDLSNDGRHVFLIDQDSPHQLQDLGSGTPETVSIMPDGQPNECGLDAGQSNDSFIGGGGPNAGEAAARLWRPGYHMVAVTNGARVYFQVKPNADEREAGVTCETALYGIYERNRETGQTFLVDPGEGEAPNFIRATPDGREAFFLTSSKLDPADANSDPDVYRWSEASGESTCLTCVVPDADVSTHSRRGVLVSDDLSHVYFESPKQLVPGLGGAGDQNVYALSGGEISFVADSRDPGSLGSLKGALLSGDGDVLVFEALAGPSMTTDPVAPSCEDALGHAQACHELYRYDNHDDGLECISCAPSGPTEFSVGSPTGTGVNDFAMSADGSTVAFATVQTLTPQDVNGFVDIYEWRDGVRSLLTNGVDTFQTGIAAAPQVMGVSADGSNILFSVVDPGLTGFEQDGLAGLYDARIDGGFTPPTPPVHCAEDSCQGPLVPAPSIVQPASADFAGRGNLGKEGGARPRCAKGRARRHGRCVRRHREKAHRHHNHRRSK